VSGFDGGSRTPGVQDALLPHGMCSSQKLERCVICEHPIGPRRGADEISVRKEALFVDAGRYRGVDPPRHVLDAAAAQVVLELVVGSALSVGPPPGLGELAEGKDGVIGEECIEIELAFYFHMGKKVTHIVIKRQCMDELPPLIKNRAS